MIYKDTSRRSLVSGFTIVELIVVIAVIGILASIAIVSYSGSQNRAKKSSFEANAQQVKLKLGDYMTDKNGYPRTKADVQAYLDTLNNPTLKTEFDKTAYTYVASGCGTAPALCDSYTITVAGTNWSASSESVTVQP